MHKKTNNGKQYHKKNSLFPQTSFIYGLYASLQRTTAFPLFNGAVLPINIVNALFQAIMRKKTNNVKLYHGKNSLFLQTSFIYGLYGSLQRKTGSPIFNGALVPTNIVNPQFQAIMCKKTNNVKLYHGRHSLFLQTSFIYGLYESLQRTTGFPIVNGAPRCVKKRLVRVSSIEYARISRRF